MRLSVERPVLRCLMVIGALAAFRVPTAAGQQPTTARVAINRYCPVLTDQEVDPSITTTYRGQTIAFCCEKCLAKFKANPQRYAARLAALMQQAERVAPDEHDGASEEGQPDHATHGRGIATAHEHAHEHERPARHGLIRLIAWLGKFHPPMVNFPIAMLIGAGVAELLLVLTRRPVFACANRFCLWFGAAGAVAAAGLGWCFGGWHLSDNSWILTMHRWLGTSTAVWSLLVLALGERAFRAPSPPRRRAYRLALFVDVALVTVTGFFGGSLIYGLNHYAW